MEAEGQEINPDWLILAVGCTQATEPSSGDCSRMADEIDIVVIGAGAAGIAAGRMLSQADVDFLIIDAADRIGGRAWTRTAAGHPLDLGCGWLHSADRNPWTAIAEESGFEIDRTPPAWGKQFENLGFTREEQEQANAAYEALDKRLKEEPPASDRASDALEPGGAWNDYIEARSGYINGIGTADVSVEDYLAYDGADSGENWRLPQGYGALIAAAAKLPIRLGVAASCIDRRTTPLRIETSHGIVSTRAVIVAVPTPILAREALRFLPEIEGKAEAAAHLPLGLANKLFLALDHPEELAADCHMIGNPKRAETGSYYLRPFGRPMIEAFFGGAGAQELERAGVAGMADFAAEELADLFGSAFRKRIHPLLASSWGAEPLIGGSYSHACPGHAAARQQLAQPVEGRIFFAGEACSGTDFSTAHGAYETGVRAAEAAIAALARCRPG